MTGLYAVLDDRAVCSPVLYRRDPLTLYYPFRTLLDVLAQRTSMGVITGDMLVNGNALSPDFQRNTGYVQQQDLHLETATVRESLRFSAILRQPKSTPREEKIAYVEEVITMLGMEEFAEAVVGVPGEGLNVEQRKFVYRSCLFL